MDVAGVIEQPTFPSWAHDPEVPSIWQLKACLALEKTPCVDRVDLDLSTTGLSYRKPISLLAIEMPAPRELVITLPNNGQCFHTHKLMKGRTASGVWNTSHAKEYTPILSCLFARAVTQTLEHANENSVDLDDTDRWRALHEPFLVQFDGCDSCLHEIPADFFINKFMAD